MMQLERKVCAGHFKGEEGVSSEAGELGVLLITKIFTYSFKVKNVNGTSKTRNSSLTKNLPTDTYDLNQSCMYVHNVCSKELLNSSFSSKNRQKEFMNRLL